MGLHQPRTLKPLMISHQKLISILALSTLKLRWIHIPKPHNLHSFSSDIICQTILNSPTPEKGISKNLATTLLTTGPTSPKTLDQDSSVEFILQFWSQNLLEHPTNHHSESCLLINITKSKLLEQLQSRWSLNWAHLFNWNLIILNINSTLIDFSLDRR